jgi:hypothetical protein
MLIDCTVYSSFFPIFNKKIFNFPFHFTYVCLGVIEVREFETVISFVLFYHLGKIMPNLIFSQEKAKGIGVQSYQNTYQIFMEFVKFSRNCFIFFCLIFNLPYKCHIFKNFFKKLMMFVWPFFFQFFTCMVKFWSNFSLRGYLG